MSSSIAQPSKVQTEMRFECDEYLVDPRDWHVVWMLQVEMEEDFRQRKGLLLRKIGQWSTLYNLFKKIEKRTMLESANYPSERDLRFHRIVSLWLQCSGESLVQELKLNEDLPIEMLGISFKSLFAAVHALRADYFAWHSDDSPDKSKAVINDVFGSSE